MSIEFVTGVKISLCYPVPGRGHVQFTGTVGKQLSDGRFTVNFNAQNNCNCDSDEVVCTNL